MTILKSILLIGLMITGFSYSYVHEIPIKYNATAFSVSADTLDTNGKILLEKNCYACHSPALANQQRLAPPIQMVKMHYINDHPEKDDFVQAVVKWVGEPEENISKMPHALTRFGVMPKMIFPEEELKAIAEYLYDTKMEPIGREMREMMHQKQGERPRKMGDRSEAFVYPQILQEGQEFVKKAQTALGSNLVKAIGRSGTAGAVEFCSTRAIALTDSIANELDVFIKRVTDQPRNPVNRAGPVEMAYIIQTKNNLEADREVNPVVFVNGDKWRGYYPIVTNNLCLQCHGSESTDIDPETLKNIRASYPDDEATGYSVSELRGIWVIDF